MEQIQALWLVIFFLFSLTLIFTWTKVSLITGKVRRIDTLLTQIEAIDAQQESPEKKPDESARG
ncbi:MAG: hypothetical protein MUF22_02755 [Chitinispirillaceae bacterium]|jgi:hypothetical protein|nr:hypothetical protein [Chitinispirillaceae bacterium]